MSESRVRLVWNGKSLRGVPAVLGCVDTTIPSILKVLGDLGKHPDEFNEMVVEAKARPDRPVPCILWAKGTAVGEILYHLRSKGLCKEVPSAP